MDKKPMSERYIKLSEAELQSGLDRVTHAELMIAQMPRDHGGANTWLLNYGKGTRGVDLRERHGVKFIEQTRCAETTNSKGKDGG